MTSIKITFTLSRYTLSFYRLSWRKKQVQNRAGRHWNWWNCSRNLSKPRKVGETASTAQARGVQFVTQENKVILFDYFSYALPISNWTTSKILPENPQGAILDWKDGWILSLAFGIFGGVICLIIYPFLLTRLCRFLLGLFYQWPFSIQNDFNLILK